MTARFPNPTDRNYYTETPRTMAQATDQRAWENAKMEAKYVKHDARQAARVAAIQVQHPADPRVGVLMRKGSPVYYANVAGHLVDSSDLQAVEAKLKQADEATGADFLAMTLGPALKV